MRAAREVSIVLPAYREAESLRSFLPLIRAEVERLTLSFEILVVDSLQPLDDTQAVCNDAGVRHLFRTGGNSYGDAVRTGIANSFGRYLVFMDADGSHDPRELESLWNKRTEFEIVIGSRYIPGGRTENPLVLQGMSLFLNAVYRISVGLKVRDVSNSFRLYRGDQLRGLSLHANNFEIVEEILVKLIAGPDHASVTEVPISFRKRSAGESKRNLVQFGVSYLKSIRRLRQFRRDSTNHSNSTAVD
jgi:dolichol-phosphate mannosyltransferase